MVHIWVQPRIDPADSGTAKLRKPVTLLQYLSRQASLYKARKVPPPALAIQNPFYGTRLALGSPRSVQLAYRQSRRRRRFFPPASRSKSAARLTPARGSPSAFRPQRPASSSPSATRPTPAPHCQWAARPMPVPRSLPAVRLTPAPHSLPVVCLTPGPDSLPPVLPTPTPDDSNPCFDPQRDRSPLPLSPSSCQFFTRASRVPAATFLSLFPRLILIP